MERKFPFLLKKAKLADFASKQKENIEGFCFSVFHPVWVWIFYFDIDNLAFKMSLVNKYCLILLEEM